MMTGQEKENWIINVENSVAAIDSEIGEAAVNAILARYSACCIEDICPADLPGIFSELYAIEADLR